MMQKMRKWVVVLLVACLLLTSVAPVLADGSGSGSQNGGKNDKDWTYDSSSYNSKNTYYYYMENHKEAAYPKREIAVDVTNFRVIQPDFAGVQADTKLYSDKEGSSKGVEIEAKGEKVVFTVEIPETGLYGIELNYFPLASSGSQIMFGVQIDGEVPFTEANSCVLSRVFTNQAIETDEYGDDLRPQSVQTPQWRKQFLFDKTGVSGVLHFYFEKGTHEMSLCFDGTPILLEGLTLKQEKELLSYEDYVAKYKQEGAADTAKVLELFQAEKYLLQSDSSLWPAADKSSSLTQPFSYENIKINYGGGLQWKQPGQWISWEIDVPADGFYNLGLKYRQSYLDGLFSSRRVYVDGEVPFKELDAVRFNYSGQWKNLLLGGEAGPYSIYLKAGKHTITMENVIGDLSSTMGVLQTVVANLNDLYLSIIMITSSDPDPYRDYYIERQIPTLPDDLRANAELLLQEAKRLETIVGSRGAENAYFEDVAYNLQTYAGAIEDLTYKNRLTNLKNDINGLSAKLSLYQEQALDIDYIALLSADEKMPKTAMNVWEWIVYQVKSFFASFINKRDNDDKENSIRVWINTGIDQYEIMKNMIVDEFTPKYGINVDLELAQGSLVNALAAGTGPDVMLNVGSETVVNLALRGAVVDLSQFEGYFDVLSEYVEGAEIPFTLEGRYYGMPNTNGCSVMFVRTDIFKNMGLKVPDTWDDMYDLAQVLQRYNMSLGSSASFQNLLYQNGGSYFNEDLTEVCFDEQVAIDALIQHAEFFTKYGFPKTFDFANRFRTGEMPIGITTYDTYVTLKYTAPEISGLWEMYPIPGTLKPDGSIDRTQMDQSGIGAIMLSDAKNYDNAWAFIKWWSQAEAQTRYANDVEAALGISARYNTANLTTLRSQGWTVKELAILESQFEWLQFIPIVPGNYYVTRGVNNSIRGVIDRGENARELLTEWTIKINEEILRKRNEFYQNNK